MKRILLILFFVTHLSSLYAIESITLKLRIQTYKGDSDGLRVELYCNSVKETSLKVSKTGKCNVVLIFNKDYRLAIVKKGYVTKYIDVNTDVPSDILDYDSKFPPMKLDVKLYPFRKNVDVSIFNQPVEKMYYDKILDDLVFDKDYAHLIKDRIKKTEDLLKNSPIKNNVPELTDADIQKELAKIKIPNIKQQATKVGDKDNEKLPHKAKASVKTPRMKAVSVVGMIGGMRVVADASSKDGEGVSFEEQQARIIKALGLKQNDLKPMDSLATVKIDPIPIATKPAIDSSTLIIDSIPKEEIVEKLAEVVIPKPVVRKKKKNPKRVAYESLYEQAKARIDNNYKMLIEKGDAAFKIGNYAISKFYFIQARQIKSFEKYPVEKLQEIQSILMDSKYQELKKKFNELVNKADGYFKKNSYVVARFYYERARDIWSWDEHCKKRLKEIEAKIGK